jgi:hypothetical protein
MGVTPAKSLREGEREESGRFARRRPQAGAAARPLPLAAGKKKVGGARHRAAARAAGASIKLALIVLAMCNYCSDTLCGYNKCPVIRTSIKLVPVLLFRKFVCIMLVTWYAEIGHPAKK